MAQANPAGEATAAPRATTPTPGAEALAVPRANTPRAGARVESIGAWAGARAETGARAKPNLPLPGVLVLAGLATAAAAQGGYHTVGQLALVGTLASAVAASVVGSRGRMRGLPAAPALAAGALAGWAVVSGALAGDPRDALSIVGLLAGVAAVFVVCPRLSRPEREVLLAGAIGVGAVVALTGWIGVAFRVTPWALESSGLWRAATTLTYANAAAGLMVPLALSALAFVVARPSSKPACASACLLVVSVAATISRFGILTLVLGGMALGLIAGLRRSVQALTPVAAGAAVALASLLPSIPGSARPQPVLAAAGLAGGLAIAVFGDRAMPRERVASPGLRRGLTAALAVSAAVLVALGLVAVGRLAPDLHAISAVRLTLASPARTDSTQAALHLAATRPLTGVGPGQAGLSWAGPDGSRLFSRYAHDEYLQLLTETGAIGAGLLLVLLGAAGVTVARGRWAPSRELWAGSVAGLAAFALHSGADFLWHIPVIPLTAALLIGISAPLASPETAVRSTPCPSSKEV